MCYRRFLLVLLLLWGAVVMTGEVQASVSCRSATVRGTGVSIISVDMNDKAVKVSPILAQPSGRNEAFSSMVGRKKPTAAVSGTFFCRNTLKPIGDVVIDGNLEVFGGFGTAVAITPDNQVRFIRVAWGRRMDWTGYESVIAGGPRLLKNGKVCLDPVGEGFKDPHVLGVATRIAVGRTSANQLLFVATGAVSLEELALIMLELKCSDAINLEGGASIAMYCRGRYLLPAGRHLTNIIGIYEKHGVRPVTVLPVITSDVVASGSGGGKGGVSVSPDSLYSASRAEYGKGNLVRALELITQAVGLNPSAANYRFQAELHEELGNDAEASVSYTEVARIYYKKGDFNASYIMSDRALSLDPSNLEAADLFRKSKEGRGMQ